MSEYTLIFCQINYFYAKKKKRNKKHTEVIKPGSVICDINYSPFQLQMANLKQTNKTKQENFPYKVT